MVVEQKYLNQTWLSSNELDIPIMHVNNIKTDGLLLTVDCQYGAAMKIEAPHVAVIDHHQQEIEDIELRNQKLPWKLFYTGMANALP